MRCENTRYSLLPFRFDCVLVAAPLYQCGELMPAPLDRCGEMVILLIDAVSLCILRAECEYSSLLIVNIHRC